MLAFTVTDLDRQRSALQQVLRLNPDNKKAKAQLEKVSNGEALVFRTRSDSGDKAKPETQGPWYFNSFKLITISLVVLLLCGSLVIWVGLIIRYGRGIFFWEQEQPAISASAGVPATPVPTAMATMPPEPGSEPSPTPTTAAYTPVFTPLNCNFETPREAIVDCGFVTIPEDRNGNISDTIQLAVAVYHSPGHAPAPDPVIFLQGGPGSGAIESTAAIYESFIKPMVAERDVIVFDQRGTGLSQPTLDCWELNAVYQQDLTQNISTNERATFYTEAIQACHDRLERNGVKVTAYTSRASAADIKDIVTALGYEQVNLYGISYGTRLALVTIRDYAEIVRSVILDSALPPEIKYYNQGSAKANDALQVLFTDCAANPDCNTAYPDLETVFYNLVKQLNTEPASVETFDLINGELVDMKLSGTGLINAVIWAMHSSDYIPVIPKIIYDIHNGDYSFMKIYLAMPTQTYDEISLGSMLSINCHEQIFATTPEELAADLAAYPDTEAWGKIGLYGSIDAIFSACEIWEAAPFEAYESEPVVSDIPTLIIAGQYDPTTPPTFSQQTAKNLSNSYYFEFPGLGHAPTVNLIEQCPLNIALAFLSNPTRHPDNPCFTDMHAPQFVTPTDVTDIEFEQFVNDEYQLSGIIPSGWKDIGAGFYNRNNSALDPTQLGVQGAFVSIEEWVKWLAEKFSNVGLDETPQYTGEYKALNDLTWKLYEAKFRGNPVDLALVETDNNQTLLVAMVCESSEHQQLYEAVFLPVLESITPGGSPAALANDENGVITVGTCRFVSEDTIALNEGQKMMTVGEYLYTGPPDKPLAMKSLAYLTVIDQSDLPESITLHEKTYTLVSDGVSGYTIDTNQALPAGQESLHMVDLTLVSIEPDIEDPITLNLGSQDYPLQLAHTMDEFTRNLFSALGVSEQDEENICQYHPAIQAEIEAMNSIK